MSLLNKFFNNVRARTVDLRQSADDGTDRVIVRGSDGNAKAEVFFDGTNTVVNPLTGDVNLQGNLSTGGDLIDAGNSTTVYDQSTQTIGSGNETADVNTVTTDKLNNADFTTALDGQVLTKTATGDEAAWEAAPGGATTLIESQSPSGVSSADFTSSFGSHEGHVFYLHNVVPATDNDKFYTRTSTDAGQNWDAGASDYDWVLERVNIAGTNAQATADDTSEIQLIGGGTGVGSAASESGISGTVSFYGTGKSESTMCTWIITNQDANSGDGEHLTGSGYRIANEDVTGVRFLFSSGNIESGTIEHLGVA